MGGGGGKITPYLKLVRLILETCYVSTLTYAVSENILVSTKTLLIFLTPAFFCKKYAFFGQNSIFTKSNIRSVFSFCKIKSYC